MGQVQPGIIAALIPVKVSGSRSPCACGRKPSGRGRGCEMLRGDGHSWTGGCVRTTVVMAASMHLCGGGSARASGIPVRPPKTRNTHSTVEVPGPEPSGNRCSRQTSAMDGWMGGRPSVGR